MLGELEIFVSFLFIGGNQRELARAKNMKKQQEMAKKKGHESAQGLKTRQERWDEHTLMC